MNNWEAELEFCNVKKKLELSITGSKIFQIQGVLDVKEGDDHWLMFVKVEVSNSEEVTVRKKKTEQTYTHKKAVGEDLNNLTVILIDQDMNLIIPPKTKGILHKPIEIDNDM